MKAVVVLQDMTYTDLIKKVGAYRRDQKIEYGTPSYFIWADTLESLTQMTDVGAIDLPRGVTFSSYRFVVERATGYDATLVQK